MATNDAKFKAAGGTSAFVEGESDEYDSEDSDKSNSSVDPVNFDLLNVSDKDSALHKSCLGYVTRMLCPTDEVIQDLRWAYERDWKKKVKKQKLEG